MELSEINELQGKWLKLDEILKLEIENLKAEKSETLHAQKFENLKATLKAHDEARNTYFEAVRDWASKKKN